MTMPDPKRCEVCKKPQCSDSPKCGKDISGHFYEMCHLSDCPRGSSPRSDDSEKACSNGTCATLIKNGLPPLEHNAVHPTPKEVPPRTKEWERFKNKYGLGSLYTKQEAYLKNPYKEVFEDVMRDIEALLLSSRKEGENEMFRKCVEAVEEARELAEKLDGFPFVRGKHMGLREAGQVINALNPDNSSPDEGREG